QGAEIGATHARRILQHRLEYRLQLTGRARDDLEHLGGRGLLLQRLAYFARARLHLVEQPHVLDRNHRLVGEGGDEFDLLFGERLHPGAYQRNDTDRDSFPQQWHAEHCAVAGQSRKRIFGVFLNIVDMYDFAFKQGSPYARSWSGLDRKILQIFLVLGRRLVRSSQFVHCPMRPPDVRDMRFAKARRRLNKRVQHGLQVECRAADDLQHVSGGGLLLKRFTQIVRALAQLLEQPRVLDGDDSLTGKILDQLDVLLAEGTNLLAIKDNGAL